MPHCTVSFVSWHFSMSEETHCRMCGARSHGTVREAREIRESSGTGGSAANLASIRPRLVCPRNCESSPSLELAHYSSGMWAIQENETEDTDDPCNRTACADAYSRIGLEYQAHQNSPKEDLQHIEKHVRFEACPLAEAIFVLR